MNFCALVLFVFLVKYLKGESPLKYHYALLCQVVWRLNWGHVSDKCSQENTVLEDSRVFGEITCPMAVEADQVSCDWRIRVT